MPNIGLLHLMEQALKFKTYSFIFISSKFCICKYTAQFIGMHAQLSILTSIQCLSCEYCMNVFLTNLHKHCTLITLQHCPFKKHSLWASSSMHCLKSLIKCQKHFKTTTSHILPINHIMLKTVGQIQRETFKFPASYL